jgi:hypothetical protein
MSIGKAKRKCNQSIIKSYMNKNLCCRALDPTMYNILNLHTPVAGGIKRYT